MLRLALLLLWASSAAAAAWPPELESLLPGLPAAERRLQDASLAHEAARRESQPANDAVSAARSEAQHWWGRWRLRRALGRLKDRLDKVEAARVEREAARQELFLLLTALEEELRSALEKGLRAPQRPAPAVLKAWWRQAQAWAQRLEALEAGQEAAAPAPEQKRLLAQARLEQLERDRELLKVLSQRRVLDAGEANAESLRLERSWRRWRGLARAGAP